MKVKIEIKLDNEAFDVRPTITANERSGYEVGRILKELSQKIPVILSKGNTFYLFDVNGNQVGTFKVTR